MKAVPSTVAIVGAGSIGASLAIVFARAGSTVHLVDIDPDTAERGRLFAAARLATATERERVMTVADLGGAVANADLVLECAAEDLATKRELFQRLEELCPAAAILASTSSALTASGIAGELNTRQRTLIAHPANPPHVLALVEVVPAPFTSTDVVDTVLGWLRAAGSEPVVVQREVDGFVMNRLQGAVLREAYCLVRDGVADVAAIDQVVRSSLGPRWAITGPFETADLNTRGGIAAHAHRLGPAYARMGAERGQDDPWTDDLVAEVERQRRELLPLQDWEHRVAWRERELRVRSEGPTGFSLRGRRALVTGGGRGIGRAIAGSLAAAGAHVVVTSRTRTQLDEVVADITESGGTAEAIPGDLSDHVGIGALLDEAEGSAPIDIVVHAAGTQHREAARTFPAEKWAHVLDVNLTAPFLLSQEIGRRQLDRGAQGSHIFVASLTSVLGLPNLVAYNAAKSGLMGVVRALSREWSQHGLRFNGIAPGYVETEMTKDLFADPDKRAALLSRIPMGEFGTPEQLGPPAVFLAGDAAEYLTGQLLIVDGGWAAA